MARTYDSPATNKQRGYVLQLLEDRVVPTRVRQEVEEDLETLTDGDCRRIIPDLEGCAPEPVFNAASFTAGAVNATNSFVGLRDAFYDAGRVGGGYVVAVDPAMRINWDGGAAQGAARPMQEFFQRAEWRDVDLYVENDDDPF